MEPAAPSKPHGRRIGIELEYSNLPLHESTRVIRELFGGRIDKNGRYSYTVMGTALGDFHLEVDALLLKSIAASKTMTNLSELFREYGDIAKLIDRTATRFIPFEIAAPPVPIEKITQMDTLTLALRKAGAQGTTEKLHYAFGLHLNIELPTLTPQVLLQYLRAFLMLQHWLERQIDIDLTRRLSPFIDPFPKNYIRLVTAKSYSPGWNQMMRDYLAHNPSRNRALDLLPLLAHMDEALIRSHLPDEKINPRPTLHYRLPNSKVDRFTWRVSDEWALWQNVEQLVDDHNAFESLRNDFIDYLDDPFSSKDDWVERVHRCLIALL